MPLDSQGMKTHDQGINAVQIFGVKDRNMGLASKKDRYYCCCYYYYYYYYCSDLTGNLLCFATKAELWG